MKNMAKTKRCTQVQEIRRSSGKLAAEDRAGVAAAKEMGSPPRGGETGSGEDGGGASLPKLCEAKFRSGGFSGSSSKWLIVFPRGVSWATPRPARRRPAARAARGGR